ncbi:MAG: SDR family oxidoreductase [Planctomycetia bacterium]|nr:SDR family oxidoreductase [Planctomycetia bacterium]
MPTDAKTIVLTGVSRGLGLAMAEGLIERGHVVCGSARDKAAIAALRKRWPSPHRFRAVDVADDKAVRDWAADVREAVGAPDLLLNNAALMNEPAPLWKVPPDEFARLMDVNIRGVYHVIRHFVPAMVKRRRGVIVNFSSGWGRSTDRDVAPYCATKWAIEGLTRSLAQELPKGMAAVPLNPGVINTDMLRTAWGREATSYQTPEAWAKSAVPFLLSLSAKDNGQPLAVRSSR